MGALSAEEVMKLARDAGFKGDEAVIATTIAKAESDLDPKKHNTTPPDDSYGLWQINMYKDLGPDRRKRFGLTSNEQLYDPKTNARVAYGIYKESGWNAWTTYKNGKAGKAIISDSPAKKTGDVIDSVPSALSALGNNVFKGVTNIGGIMVGISFLALGVILLIMSSNTAKKALNVAANVVPGGSVIKGEIKKAVAK